MSWHFGLAQLCDSSAGHGWAWLYICDQLLISGLIHMSDDPAGSLGSLMRGQLQVVPKQQDGKPQDASGF